MSRPTSLDCPPLARHSCPAKERKNGWVWLQHTISVAADVCVGTALLALWGAVFDPSSWWPAVAFALFVLYLVLNHVRFEAKARLGDSA